MIKEKTAAKLHIHTHTHTHTHIYIYTAIEVPLFRMLTPMPPGLCLSYYNTVLHGS